MTTFNRNVMAIFVAKYITKNENVFLYAFTRETLRLNQFPTEPLYRSTLFLLFPCKLCVPSEILTHLLIGSKHMIFNANLRNSTKQYKIITNNRLCNGVLPAVALPRQVGAHGHTGTVASAHWGARRPKAPRLTRHAVAGHRVAVAARGAVADAGTAGSVPARRTGGGTEWRLR